MPLQSNDLGPLVGRVVDLPAIRTSPDLIVPDDVDAVLNATGKPRVAEGIRHCRVNVSEGAETAMGRAVGFLRECERDGLRVIVCGPDAQRIVDAFNHRVIVR